MGCCNGIPRLPSYRPFPTAQPSHVTLLLKTLQWLMTIPRIKSQIFNTPQISLRPLLPSFALVRPRWPPCYSSCIPSTPPPQCLGTCCYLLSGISPESCPAHSFITLGALLKCYLSERTSSITPSDTPPPPILEHLSRPVILIVDCLLLFQEDKGFVVLTTASPVPTLLPGTSVGTLQVSVE